MRCANCIDYNTGCTQTEPSRKRGPKSQVDALQQRVQKMETILRQIGAEGPTESVSSPESASSPRPSTKSQDGEAGTAPSTIMLSPPLRDPSLSDSEGEQDAEDLDHIDLNNKMKHLTLGIHNDRFFGQSSSFVFLNKALDIKGSITHRREDGVFASEEVWKAQPWELSSLEEMPPQHSFPDSDLLRDLTNLYFDHINLYFPLLHRPTFEANVIEGLHLRNHLFGEVVLLLAAAASRFSNDPRVLMDDSTDWLASGWKWFSQVQLLPKALVRTSSLYEIQKFCLASYYLHGSSTPQIVWTLVGVGLRFAQERGVHRRKRPGHRWTVEDELWKRAFWVLLSIDRLCCSILGRPCSIHDEDFDVELPAACDDEYWENPDSTLAFKQPEGMPSKVTFFNVSMRLSDILAFTLRTIYAVGKFKAFLAKSNTRWQEDVVQKIDSALNKWHDMVPEFLRWPSNKPGTAFYRQSAGLYVTYYYIQIQAHRPFIPSISGHPVLSQPSLLICANAARSCSHIFASLHKNTTVTVHPFFGPMAFTSGIFLLLYIWEAEKSGFSVDVKRELQNVKSCLSYLRDLQKRFCIASRFAELLQHLIIQEESLDGKPSEPVAKVTTERTQPMPQNMASGAPLPNNSDMGPQSTGSYPPHAQQSYDDIFSSLNSNPAAYDFAQMASDPMDLLRAFTGESVAGEEYNANWASPELNDLSMFQDFGTENMFYQNMLASLNDPASFGQNTANMGPAQPNSYPQHQQYPAAWMVQQPQPYMGLGGMPA